MAAKTKQVPKVKGSPKAALMYKLLKMKKG